MSPRIIKVGPARYVPRQVRFKRISENESRMFQESKSRKEAELVYYTKYYD
jgi:hypothetical protein